MTKTLRWPELGRPEAALIGVQYRANDRGTHRGRWQVRDASAEPWLFAGTGLRNGSRFSSAGIEIDRACAELAPADQAGRRDLEHLRAQHLGQHVYYETRAGAKVFAAGAFSFAAAIWQPPVRQMAENLWARLADDRDTGGRGN